MIAMGDGKSGNSSDNKELHGSVMGYLDGTLAGASPFIAVKGGSTPCVSLPKADV